MLQQLLNAANITARLIFVHRIRLAHGVRRNRSRYAQRNSCAPDILIHGLPRPVLDLRAAAGERPDLAGVTENGKPESLRQLYTSTLAGLALSDGARSLTELFRSEAKNITYAQASGEADPAGKRVLRSK